MENQKSKAEELAEQHYKFLEKWIHIIYVDSFVHGYKHGYKEGLEDGKSK
jgi:flagellar biosynthesis/type III secretory pathway protein FliH